MSDLLLIYPEVVLVYIIKCMRGNVNLNPHTSLTTWVLFLMLPLFISRQLGLVGPIAHARSHEGLVAMGIYYTNGSSVPSAEPVTAAAC